MWHEPICCMSSNSVDMRRSSAHQLGSRHARQLALCQHSHFSSFRSGRDRRGLDEAAIRAAVRRAAPLAAATSEEEFPATELAAMRAGKSILG
jgi:hypothetical protein